MGDQGKKREVSGQQAVDGASPTASLLGPSAGFDLKAEANRLRDLIAWGERGLASRTLLKHNDLRLVLIALKSGERIERHQTDHCVSVHTLDGQIRLSVESDHTVDVPAGRVIVLDRKAAHDVLAVEDSVFLLSLAGAAQNA